MPGEAKQDGTQKNTAQASNVRQYFTSRLLVNINVDNKTLGHSKD